MRGSDKRSGDLFSYVDLEDRVPAKHPLRLIRASSTTCWSRWMLSLRRSTIYQEAKSNGFDVKILREVIRVRKQDQKERDEQDSLLDAYLQALRAPARVKAA
jgi:GapR-like nucleoid associated protein